MRTFESYHEEVMNQTNYGEETLKDFLSKCFGYCPELLAVCVRGWTPGFNDGDPCYHHEEISILFTDDAFGSEWEDFFCDDFEELCSAIKAEKQSPADWNPEYMYYSGMSLATIAALEDLPRKRVINAIKGQFYAEHSYGTNYLVIAQRTDEGNDFNYEQYDCGY